MAKDKPTIEALRVELSNLRDDLAVIASSQIFFMQSATVNEEAVNAIKHRIAEIKAILECSDK
ncbi:hypothetical protein [Phyllobacterium zundukense]|uniref:Uncharacterized protein n=1 Tax=Phyllobacterium zundukense TaxID=1867719 RepID=A0ACD4CZW5_9HYPH|nr:hypothetical protein [Phyllobacterium zundukense]UXN59101.1 hypothetical protein N8E88_09520 [Phyllobacterium zundukense]